MSHMHHCGRGDLAIIRGPFLPNRVRSFHLIVTREERSLVEDERTSRQKDVILAWSRSWTEEGAPSQAAAPSRYASRALPYPMSSHLPEQRVEIDVGATGGRGVDNASGRGLFMPHPLILYHVVDHQGNSIRIYAATEAGVRKQFGDDVATVEQLEPGVQTCSLPAHHTVGRLVLVVARALRVCT